MSTQSKPLASGLSALRPRARIIQALGEDLISNQVIALIELIKNAYDADAHKVDIRFESPLQKGKGTIVVQDDGHGMSIDVLKNAWMEPATDAKTGKLTSPAGRRFTGEKGLGRFAASRLADWMHVESVSRRPLRRVMADFNWSEFKQTNKYLDQIKCSWKEFKAPRGSDTGTLLRLVGLHDDWDEKAFVRLRAELARLVSRDNSQADRFEISLHLPSAFREHTGPVTPPPVLSRANFSMEGAVSSEGHLAAKMKTGEKQKPVDLEIKLERGRKPISGPFTFRFEVWERERDNLIKLADELGSTLRDLRRDLDAACGISIYRDVFRVLPYGGPDNDWLRLDIRRVQNPTLRFSNNQIVGSVRITRDENSELRDQTNREGIVESQAFDDLRTCVKEALSSLETWRFQYRRNPAKEDMGEGLFHEFDIEPIKASFQERHPEDKEFVKYLDEHARKVKKSVKEVQNVLVRYRRLATLGQLIDVVLHEGRTPVTGLSNECALGLRALKKAKTLGALQDDVLQRYKVIKNQTNLLSLLFHRIAPFGGRKRGRPIQKTVEKMICESFDVFASQIDELKVDVSLSTGKTRVRVDPPEFQQIIVNLLDNALYWIAKVPLRKRKIEVRCQRIDSGVEVLFCDSGPGVPEDVQDRIFEPYFSTKPDGVGLGLAIVGETAAEYDGTLELVSPGLLPGANFRILLKRRVGDED